MSVVAEQSSKISEKDCEIVSSAAFEDFISENYDACLQCLSKLESSLESNTKVQHNKAVVEFYQSGLKDVDQFRKTISQITNLSGEFKTVEIKDVELCAAHVNQAIILYHSKQPLAALRIMMAVMEHFDHLDDYMLQKAGLFTVHLLLDTYQPKGADGLLELLQKHLAIVGEEILNSDDEEIVIKEKIIPSAQFEEFKKEFRLILIRSNLLNVKSILIPSEDTSEYSFLKGHQYYLGNDYQMAAKELSKKFINNPVLVKTHGEDQNTCLANNMGLIHFAVKHYALAARFLQQALLFDKSATEIPASDKDEGTLLHCIGATKRPEILYNLGIALLYLQRPKEAFECLLVALNSYHNNPRLWLRLAECCIMVHKQQTKEKETKNIASAVIGSGVHRKYVLTPSPNKYVSDDSQSFAIPSTNLEFASLCLRNALTIIDYHSTFMYKHQPSTEKNSHWSKLTEGVHCNPSKPLKLASFDKLKCAVLTAYSYVLLSLGEYTIAFKHAKEILNIENLPETHLMLAHLYCAESLIMMDRASEALVYLDPKFIKELRSEDFETRGSPNWNVNSVEAAQSVLTYNLAVALLVQGDYDMAKNVMAACKHPVVFPHLKMLKMYVELLAGNLDNCKIMIKIDSPQYL